MHYRIINGGHTWPGSPILIGITNQDFNASAVIWNFFNQFSLKTGTNNIISESNIKISQNPFTTFIEIQFSKPDKSIINIFSPDGKLIQSTEHNEDKILLDESALPCGLYFLNILQNNNSKTFRMAKVHK